MTPGMEPVPCHGVWSDGPRPVVGAVPPQSRPFQRLLERGSAGGVSWVDGLSGAPARAGAKDPWY